MTMPGFSADACLYEPNGFYPAVSVENSASFSERRVVPAGVFFPPEFLKVMCKLRCEKRCLEHGGSPHTCAYASMYCCYHGLTWWCNNYCP
jgi:hypothetical protein